jgi:hypothetical protein
VKKFRADNFIRSRIHIKDGEKLGQWYEVTGTGRKNVQGESVGRRLFGEVSEEKGKFFGAALRIKTD